MEVLEVRNKVVNCYIVTLTVGYICCLYTLHTTYWTFSLFRYWY